MRNNLNVEKFSIKYLSKVRKIYTNSFPKEERFSFFLLLFNIFRKNSELYVLFDKCDLCAFIYLINYQSMTFILYLAVDNNKCDKGYGSYLLKWCLEKKKNCDIYLNIDEVSDKFSDSLIRKKRLNFYLSNNFYLIDYLSLENSGNFNILSTNKNFNLNEYIKLDKKISIWFFNHKSKVVKCK